MSSKKMWKEWKEITQNKLNNSQDESVVSQCKSSSSSHFNKIAFTKKAIQVSKQKSQKSLRFSTLEKARKSQLNGILGVISKKDVNQKSQKSNKVGSSAQQPNINILKRINSKNWAKVNNSLKQARKQHVILKRVVKGILEQFQNLKVELQNNMKNFVKQVLNMCHDAKDVSNLQNLKQQLTKVQKSLNEACTSKIRVMPSFQSYMTNQVSVASESKIDINSVIKQPNTPKLALYDRSQSSRRQQTTGQRQHMSTISSPKIKQFALNNNNNVKKNAESMILIDNQKRPITERKNYQKNVGDSFEKELSRHKDGSIYMDDDNVKPLYDIVNHMRNILNQVDIDGLI